jgi:hypothetical protein
MAQVFSAYDTIRPQSPGAHHVFVSLFSFLDRSFLGLANIILRTCMQSVALEQRRLFWHHHTSNCRDDSAKNVFRSTFVGGTLLIIRTDDSYNLSMESFHAKHYY